MRANAWDKIVSFFSPRSAFQRTRFRVAASMIARKYEGAAKGRRTKNWLANSTSANTEIEISLPLLRDRSRQLVRDNPYAAKGMQVITSNVVGWGVFTQVKVDSAQANTSGKNKSAKNREADLSSRWKAWSETTACDYDSRNNMAGLQRLVMRTVVEGGEVFVRRRRSGRRTVRTSDGIEAEVPAVQLQLLEGDFLDVHARGLQQASDGNIIIQGIEFDKEGNRVAYHMFEDHPGNALSSTGVSIKDRFKVVRIPASEIKHVYRMDRAGQIRGVPWLAPVMLRLRDFDEFEDAQLVRQKVAAMFAVFVKDIDDSDVLPQVSGESEIGEKVEPGIIEHLPPGKDITLANPPGVTGYAEYASTMLHSIAAGLGITYESMTGNWSAVNYSSGRMGYLEMGRNIEEWRNDIMISQFICPTFDWFLEGCDILGVEVSRARAYHTPPKRDMVDPQKEIEAMKDAVRSGFSTLSDSIRSMGYDPEAHFAALAADNKMIDDLKLVLDTDPRADVKRVAADAQAAQPVPVA